MISPSTAARLAVLLLASCAWGQPVLRLKARQGQRLTGNLPRNAHYILHFNEYPGADLREELARRGVRVLEYVPDNALMVSSRAAVSLAGLPLAGAGSLEALDKISPLLAEQVAGAGAGGLPLGCRTVALTGNRALTGFRHYRKSGSAAESTCSCRTTRPRAGTGKAR